MERNQLLKKGMSWLVLVALAASLVEAAAWAILLTAGRTGTRFPATTVLLRATLKPVAAPAVSIPHKPPDIEYRSNRGYFYAADERLGWTIPAGDLQVTLTDKVDGRTHRFKVRILPDGTRATSYETRPDDQRPRLFVFGDSITFGWGCYDEHSLPWLLAARFPQYRVVNLAQNGYGNIQALLQLQALRPTLRGDDRFAFVYGDYLRPRNVAAPAWMKRLYVTSAFYEDKRKFRHPFARVGDDRGIEIHHTEIFCADGVPGCRRNEKEPSDKDMVEATIRIFDEIVLIAGASRTVVAYINGPDDDAVVRDLDKKGLAVIDIRPSGTNHETDNSLPFDSHPGPLSQIHFFMKLSAGLEKRFGMTPTR